MKSHKSIKISSILSRTESKLMESLIIAIISYARCLCVIVDGGNTVMKARSV